MLNQPSDKYSIKTKPILYSSCTRPVKLNSKYKGIIENLFYSTGQDTDSDSDFFFSIFINKPSYLSPLSDYYSVTLTVDNLNRKTVNPVCDIKTFNSSQMKQMADFTSLPSRLFEDCEYDVLIFEDKEITYDEVEAILNKWRDTKTNL